MLKFSDEKYYSGNALYEMAKIRIKQKDFYEAFFTLQRAIDKDFKSQRLILYKDFTEGVLYLIKRQGDKGVEMLSSLIQKLTEINAKDRKVMAPTVHTLTFNSLIYRAYGHLFNGEYKGGHKDLVDAKEYEKLDKASEYNEIIAKGILMAEADRSYSSAHELFELSKAIFPDNKDPYLLQSLNVIMKCFQDSPNQWIDDPERRKLIMMAKEIVDEAIDKNCKLDSVIYYYRGLLHYYLH